MVAQNPFEFRIFHENDPAMGVPGVPSTMERPRVVPVVGSEDSKWNYLDFYDLDRQMRNMFFLKYWTIPPKKLEKKYRSKIGMNCDELLKSYVFWCCCCYYYYYLYSELTIEIVPKPVFNNCPS